MPETMKKGVQKVENWLDENFREVLEDHLTDPQLRSYGLFRDDERNRVESLMDEAFAPADKCMGDLEFCEIPLGNTGMQQDGVWAPSMGFLYKTLLGKDLYGNCSRPDVECVVGPDGKPLIRWMPQKPGSAR